jgi:hypothetical protein
MKILLELRPALAGHAGIPQESRLLFHALTKMGERPEARSGRSATGRGVEPAVQSSGIDAWG